MSIARTPTSARTEKWRSQTRRHVDSDRWFHPRLEMLECRCLLSISTVVGRELFYDQSSYDGGAGIDSLDGSAIATDKSAYLPGDGLAVSANLSTYTRGINGIMIDLLGGGSHASINANDFVFKTGNDSSLGGWSTAAAPSSIAVITGAGVSSSDRVEIVWGAGAVKKAWLEVQVLATPNTGLAATDAFFWANLLGDSNLNYFATGADASSVLANIGIPAPITSARDHNRSGTITGTDSSVALSNVGSLTKIDIASAGPLLSAALSNDTGPGGVPNNDGITTDPTITGTLSAVNSVASFKAGINAGQINNNVTLSGGNFTLNTAFLQAMNGGTLPDGSYVVHLLAVDALGKTATQDVPFTLTPPPTINAALADDTGPGGVPDDDGITTDPTITGTLAAVNSVVSFKAGINSGPVSTDVTISDGNFTLSTDFLRTMNGGSLPNGPYVVHLLAVDAAGQTAAQDVSFTLDATPIIYALLVNDTGLGGVPNNDGITADPRIIGLVMTINSLASFKAGINSGPINNDVALYSGIFDDIPLNSGYFLLSTDFLRTMNGGSLEDGSYVIHLLAVDAVGQTVAQDVSFTLDTTPVINAVLANDTGTGGVPDNDGITTDPTITGTLTAVNSVASFKAGINSGPISTDVTLSDGNFTLSRDFLQTMNGGALPDGTYIVHLIAVDALDKVAAQDVSFTLDGAPQIIAALANDTGPGGIPNNDGITTDPTITGTVTAVNSVASLKAGINSGPISTDVTLSGGNFTLGTDFLRTMNGGSLPNGSYVVHLLAVDAVGNVASQIVSFTLDGTPQIDAALVNDTGESDHDRITSDPTIAGTITANGPVVSFRASLDPSSGAPITNPVAGQTVTFDWALVGDSGNVGEWSGAHALSHSGGGVDAIVGSVNHAYLISKYDVTNSQYVAFLNAKDPTGANALSLYSSQMATDTANGGIGFAANQPNGSKYSVILGHGDYPVISVSWFDAIRFANWLNNGQGNGDTETGAYTIAGGGLHGENIKRSPTAKVFLPSEDEWYKAAYYNAASNSYYHYATSSNDVPDYQVPPGGNNSANYVPGGWPDPNYELSIGHVTPVGAFAASVSPYGTFDQAGNVLQWTETRINTPNGITRSLRGGSYQYVWDHMSAAYRDSADSNSETSAVGFRVASVASVDVLPLVQPDGGFVLTPSFLDNLNGAPLTDGSYVVHLQAFDSSNLAGIVDLAFTLNRSAPAVPPEATELAERQLSTAPATDFNAVASTLAALAVADAATSLGAQPRPFQSPVPCRLPAMTTPGRHSTIWRGSTNIRVIEIVDPRAMPRLSTSCWESWMMNHFCNRQPTRAGQRRRGWRRFRARSCAGGE